MTSFLASAISSREEELDIELNGLLELQPSPLIIYEPLIPFRDLSATNGWIDRVRTKINPIEMPKGCNPSVVACINCVLAWRLISNSCNVELFRYAENIRMRLSGHRQFLGDFKAFWANSLLGGGRPSGEIDKATSRYSLSAWFHTRSIYHRPEKPRGTLSWCDEVFRIATEQGMEYDDDDVDEFIMAFDDTI